MPLENPTISERFKSRPLDAVPRGYRSFVTSAGIKDTSLDLGIVVSDVPAAAAALFTRNQVKGNPVLVGMEHIRGGKISAVVVNSKNSNVATGKRGYEDCLRVCRAVAGELSLPVSQIFPSSTGVIGRRLPVDKIVAAMRQLESKLVPADFARFAEAIMTTDTFPKFAARRVGKATLVGVAKGSGMIAPNMATMLAYFFTDAELSPTFLRKVLREVADRTFHSLSVDSDTSTSDTVLILANGLAGKVPEKQFAAAMASVATELVRMLARDGEGATKLFVVTVKRARSEKEAHAIGMSIINSPLVKTAIYKGDPNWGRIFMAIGKTPGVKILPDKIRLLWGGRAYRDSELTQLARYLQENEELHLTVDLGVGNAAWTVYG
ncbi:MAG: bifunctional glutamate N-acetyltransferase/amino-acid acetyltransferase ArgJ, partial [Turneriella sp.]|nr:bifunctional glutamate N-acetyltransferase/amino-acid acetyltransferase ArgJ [Turneriella sp.]